MSHAAVRWSRQEVVRRCNQQDCAWRLRPRTSRLSLKPGRLIVPASFSSSVAPGLLLDVPQLSEQHSLVFNQYAQEHGELSDLRWVRDLACQPGMEQILTAGALLAKSGARPEDHIFSAMLGAGLLRDVLSLYDSRSRQHHAIIALGDSICGHKGIVHGGVSAMIIDEALGALVYLLKREGVLGSGAALTAQLKIKYKKPMPAGSTVVCTTSVESVKGRKGWLQAELRDRPDGVLFSSARALYVVASSPLLQVDGDFEPLELRRASSPLVQHETLL